MGGSFFHNSEPPDRKRDPMPTTVDSLLSMRILRVPAEDDNSRQELHPGKITRPDPGGAG